MTYKRVKNLVALGASLTAILLATGCGKGDPTSGTETPDPSPPAIANNAGEINENPMRNAYFGDLHVHTKNSFDAYIFGTRVGPDEAYKLSLIHI